MITTGEIVIMVVSLTAFALLGLVRRGGLALPYEPRRPVPWHAATGLLLAGLLVVLTLSNFFAPEPPVEHAEGLTADKFIEASCANAVVSLMLMGVVAASAATSTGATASDFGLPRGGRQLVGDLLLGATATLVCIGPVLLVQAAVIPLFGSGSQNPTLVMLQESKGWGVFLAAFLAAVIVAPLFEEFVCRLLLQGWLEKVEGALLRPAAEDSSAEFDSTANNTGAGEATGLHTRAETIGLVPGLAPILISSLVFSLLHLSAGPDPVALFLFAMVQGYLYQRTHRIVPCVVNHMLFNTVALTLTFWSA